MKHNSYTLNLNINEDEFVNHYKYKKNIKRVKQAKKGGGNEKVRKCSCEKGI